MLLGNNHVSLWNNHGEYIQEGMDTVERLMVMMLQQIVLVLPGSVSDVWI